MVLSVVLPVTSLMADSFHVDPYAALLAGEKLAHNFPNVLPVLRVEDTQLMDAYPGSVSCSQEDVGPYATSALPDDSMAGMKHVLQLEVRQLGLEWEP